ncbi:MAG TPA: hypothetical protein PLO23_00815 [Alphaproteobacteria bacterium]|nr:hypothetical protein [Alphaproteobacteria bacterium]
MKLKSFTILSSLLLLSACAQPLSWTEMSPRVDLFDQLSPNTYREKIMLGDVIISEDAGKDTIVTEDGYRSVLSVSLREANLYEVPAKAAYRLEATLQEFDVPFALFNTTVHARADYILYNNSKNSVVYQETVNVPCTVRFAEQINADLRLRQAYGCAVGENISHLLNVLSRK